MTSPDPRAVLLNAFQMLLSGKALPPYIRKFERHVSSDEAYLAFRRTCGWAFAEADEAQHLKPDSRIVYFGRLYLALAVHFAATKQPIGPAGIDGFVPPQKPDKVKCDEQMLLRAVATELAHTASALAPRSSGQESISVSAAEAIPMCSERSWSHAQDAQASSARSDASNRISPEELSYSLGNVAIDYSALGSDTSVGSPTIAEVAPLHIWVVRPSVDHSPDHVGKGDEPFSVCFFPSLLSALNLYSSFGDTSASEHPGWWRTLDWAEKWAADEYPRILATTAPTSLPLKGPHLARWHVARRVVTAASNGDGDCYDGRVQGPSHGAAFSMGLLQAVARAHIARQPG